MGGWDPRNACSLPPFPGRGQLAMKRKEEAKEGVSSFKNSYCNYRQIGNTVIWRRLQSDSIARLAGCVDFKMEFAQSKQDLHLLPDGMRVRSTSTL